MKTLHDPRHQKRREAVKALFADSFTKQESVPELAREILSQKDTIDVTITEAAPSWPIDKINKIDLAILRLAVYELKNTNTPPKVIIDEAIELSKEYGSESTSSFVNGVLGTIYTEEASGDEGQLADPVNT
jgi:N utilization substance protein B